MTSRGAGVGADRDGDVLVVIPAFNEQDTVASVIDRVHDEGYAALVVDDGSADRTGEVADNAGATVVRLPVNLGVGGALRCGFRYAVTHGYRIVVQCDADGQHDPSEISKLLEEMQRTGADLVIGSRFRTGDAQYATGRVRRFVMRRLARMASRRTGVEITDATSGFRAIGGNLLGSFAATYPAEYLGDTIESLARAGRAGFKIAEVGVDMRERAAGVSTASVASSSWYLVRVIAAIWLQRFRPADRRVRLALWEGGPG
jgi:glycosyltransferase involved in cell wall biosynthesis